MTRNKVNVFLLILYCISFSSYARREEIYHNKLWLENYTIYIDKANGVIYKKKDSKKTSCQIDNWALFYHKTETFAGDLLLTTDKKGILVVDTNAFLYTKDILACKNQISLHRNPVPDFEDFEDFDDFEYFDSLRVIDLNFEHQLYLAAYAVFPIESRFGGIYTAIIARFNTSMNLIDGDSYTPGFSNFLVDNLDGFNLSHNQPDTDKISLNGQYVSPTVLDCSIDARPGVWDIEKKSKVVIPDDSEPTDEFNVKLYEKCKMLFDGKKSLEELGGKLLSIYEVKKHMYGEDYE